MDVEIEAAEKQLSAFLDRRAAKAKEERAGQEHANAVEAFWREQEKRHAEERQEYNRNLWITYFRTLARSHARLAEENEARAEALCENGNERKETA